MRRRTDEVTACRYKRHTMSSSVTASFTAAVVLLAIGVVTTRRAAIGSFDQIEDLIAGRAGTQVCAANAEAA